MAPLRSGAIRRIKADRHEVEPCGNDLAQSGFGRVLFLLMGYRKPASKDVRCANLTRPAPLLEGAQRQARPLGGANPGALREAARAGGPSKVRTAQAVRAQTLSPYKTKASRAEPWRRKSDALFRGCTTMRNIRKHLKGYREALPPSPGSTMPHTPSFTHSISPCAVLSAFGLMSALLWCTLMGHAPGFLLSSTGMDSWGNARIFWLAGISCMSVLLIAMPRFFKRRDGLASVAVPLVSMMGSALFALSFHQNLLPPGALAIGGLVVAGAGYFWIVGRFVLMLTRTQGFPAVVWCIVAAFPLRQLCSIALDLTLPPEGQVTVAVFLPLCSVLFFLAACRNRHSMRAGAQEKIAFGMPSRARETQAARHDVKNILILLVVSAIMLAVVRALGMSGTWGDSRMVYFGSLGYLPGLAALSACLVAFAWFALIKMQHRPISLRFQPAIIIVMAGLFIVAAGPSDHDSPNVLASSLIEVNDPLAHLVFWSVVSVAVDTLRISAWRIAGIAGLVYGLCSIAWTHLVSNAMITSTMVLATSYVILIGAACYLWAGGRRSTQKQAFAQRPAGKKDTLSSLRCDGCTPEACAENAMPCEERPTETAFVAKNAAQATAGSFATSTAPAAPFASADAASPQPAEATAMSKKDADTFHNAGADVESALEKRCETIAEKHRLTPREREVFFLLAQGRTRSFITEELVLSDSTVKTHISHIYAKLGIKSRRELTDMVLKID